MQTATAAPAGELSVEALEVVRTAVNLARNEQIQTTAQLRKRVAEVLPDADSITIQRGLKHWADWEARKARG
jgi:hypothetical protein